MDQIILSKEGRKTRVLDLSTSPPEEQFAAKGCADLPSIITYSGFPPRDWAKVLGVKDEWDLYEWTKTFKWTKTFTKDEVEDMLQTIIRNRKNKNMELGSI